ncbi:MAG: hypothetical protein Q8R49_06255 [Rhodoferax sp.]|nr:hypothetical protein [Rhodoferax sp.]
MRTELSAVPGVLAPLHGFWRWLMPGATRRPAQPGGDRRACQVATSSITGGTHCSKVERQNPLKTSTQKPLRIVRILEAGQAPANVGRMVISGRMADVCAELDRLAALH